MTDQSIPADKVQEVIDMLSEDDVLIRSRLEALLPKHRTLADELRALADSCDKQAKVTLSVPLKNALLRLDGEIGLFADRVETLEQERDKAQAGGRAAADNWTNTARRLEEAQAEITHLRARGIPDGWKVADHPEYGRVIVTKPTPDHEGDVHFVYPNDALVMGCDWHLCDAADLTFLDTTQEMDAR